MRSLGLREIAVRFLLGGMDQIGKLDRVLDEENRDVVADQIPIAFLGVKLDRETAHVAGQVERALVAGDCREAHENRRLFASTLKNVGARVFSERFIGFEIAVCPVAASMHDPLGYPLVIEMEDLVTEVEILDQRWPTLADLQSVLIVRDRRSERSGEDRGLAFRRLVKLTAVSTLDILVATACRLSF